MRASDFSYSIRRTLGLAFDDRKAALSVVASTATGRREIDRTACSCEGSPPEAVFGRLLQPWIRSSARRKPRAGPWVRLGLPDSLVFQAIVPITGANRNASLQSYFLEAVQTTGLRADERIIDVVKLELNDQRLACVAAAPSGRLASLIEAVHDLGARVGWAEPSPAALYRAGAYYHKTPRGSKLALRIFLGLRRAIGVLATGNQPLAYYAFDLPDGGEAAAIHAAHSTLWMVGRRSRITLPIDMVIVHGRPEIELTEGPEAFGDRNGSRWIRCAQPDYDPAAVALGLALGQETGHDLARSLRPARGFREIFPWGQMVVHSAMLGAVSLYLYGTAAEVEQRLRAAGTGLKSFPWVTDQGQTQLDAEAQRLQERSQAIESFRGDGVEWSAPLRSLASHAPENTVVTSFQGEAEVESLSKSLAGKPRKQLIVQFTSSVTKDGAVPHEIDGFLAALRSEATFQRHFPLIEVSGLQASPARGQERPFASFSIVCLPNSDSAKASPSR